jgi:hypothetical protein
MFTPLPYAIRYLWNFSFQTIEFKLISMNAVFSEPSFLGWGVCLFAALLALLKWNYRRAAARRVAKGLRSYAQVVS